MRYIRNEFLSHIIQLLERECHVGEMSGQIPDFITTGRVHLDVVAAVYDLIGCGG
ncbi:hypothetical protein D3C78_1966050 [compost metagenome]